MRVAVFVEGSGDSVPSRDERGALARIWMELLPNALGLIPPVHIEPISKKHLTAMDPDTPRSFRAIALDELIAAAMARRPFDAAVVIWDLQPPWDADVETCRWQETLTLYRLLAASRVLPAHWRDRAKARYAELRARATPARRVRPHALSAHEIGAVCMEPMFESLLQHERGVLAGLGLTRRPQGWPTGWKRMDVRAPDKALLQPAILAAQSSTRRGRIVDRIHGDMRTRKNAWGAHLLTELLADDRTRAWLMDHPLARRLGEVMPCAG